MIKKSYAKINFVIDVKGKRVDGYHELDMVMTKINFYDKIYIAKTQEDVIRLTCTNSFIPVDERNLVYRIADKVRKAFNIKDGLIIHIAKFIPIQAGLGGGSSNAATTLEMLDEMFNLNLTKQEKIALTEDLGSDIPFFFEQGIVRVQGKGEQLHKLNNNFSKDMYVILIKPRLGVSTRVVYQTLGSDYLRFNVDEVVKAIESNDYVKLINNIGNSLQAAAIKIFPGILELKAELDTYNVDGSIVCGSGSTIVAFTKDSKVVQEIKQAHENKKNFVYISRLL